MGCTWRHRATHLPVIASVEGRCCPGPLLLLAFALGGVAAAAEPSAAPTAVPQPAPGPPAMTFDEAWAWLRTELPEKTASLRPARDDGRLERLLAWAPPSATITVYDRACRPLKVSRHEHALAGEVNVRTAVRGRTKTVSGDTAQFGSHVFLSCGFDVTYERDASGKWVQTATGATGCASFPSDSLSEVTDAAAWYGARPVQKAEVKCGIARQETQRCRDGSERTCSTCQRLSLALHFVDPGTRGEYALSASSRVQLQTSVPGQPVDCALPCPVDERSAKVAAANAALQLGKLERIGLEAHPTLFRTLAACRAYRREDGAQ